MDEIAAVEPLPTTELLMQLTHVVQATFAEVAARHGFTSAQARMLCVADHEMLTMAELGRALGIEKAGVTGLVDRVEKRGLACRQAVPGDRRSTRVALTDDGATAARAFHDEVSRELATRLERITGPDAETLHRCLAALVAR